MAIPVARVHHKVAHAALPALLPTPPKWKMLPLLQTPCPCVAAILAKPPLAKPSRADADERWDPSKIKPASAEPSDDSSASGLRSADGVVRSTAGHGSFPRKGLRSADGVVRSTAGHGSFPRKNATSPPPMRGRADSLERRDAHKKAAESPASSSSSSSSGTSSLITRSKIRRATSAERWDVNKKRRPSQADQRLDDAESSSTGSNDIDSEEEEEILWKPRAMYAGPGFAVAAPESSMLPMATTTQAVRVA